MLKLRDANRSYILPLLVALGGVACTAPTDSDVSTTASTPPSDPSMTVGPSGALALDFDPTDAWGPADALLPANARIVSVDDLKLAVGEGARLLGPKQRAADESQSSARMAVDDRTISEFLAAHGGEADLAQLLAAVPPATDMSVRKLGNGDYDVTLPDGRIVRTFGTRATRALAAEGIRKYGPLANQQALYKYFFDSLPGIGGVPTPAEAASLSAAALTDAMKRVVAYGTDVLAQKGPPLGTSPDCNKAIGYGTGGDGSDYGQPTFSNKGLFSASSWPTKPYLTCAKDQGRRGTCAAFAVNSVLETSYARETGRFLNLSEQSVFANTKIAWQPDDKGQDGASPNAILDGMRTSSFVVPYEHAWNYNPSMARKPDLTASCDGYAETCSDTLGQAMHQCVRLAGYTFCTARTQGDTKVSQAGYTGSYVALGMADHSDRAYAMNMLQLALLVGKRQAIVGLVVENAFGAPNADGYIADTAGAIRGAHAVHVVAWVDNAWVPRSAPKASGGYFIVKNSWGRTYGDGGYAYVPVEWLRRNMLDIILI